MLSDDAGGFSFGDVEGVFFTFAGGVDKGGSDFDERIGGGGRGLVKFLNGAAQAVLAEEVVDEALNDDKDGDDGEDEDGPHEAAAFFEEFLEGEFHDVGERGWREWLSLTSRYGDGVPCPFAGTSQKKLRRE